MSGFKNDVLSYQCGNALNLLVWRHSELFTQGQIPVLISCMKNKYLADHCPFILYELTFDSPTFFQKKDIDALCRGLKTKDLED